MSFCNNFDFLIIEKFNERHTSVLKIQRETSKRRLYMIYGCFISKIWKNLINTEIHILLKEFKELSKHLNVTTLVNEYMILGRPLKSFTEKKSRESISYFDHSFLLLIYAEYLLASMTVWDQQPQRGRDRNVANKGLTDKWGRVTDKEVIHNNNCIN